MNPWKFRTTAQHWWFVRQWMMAMVQMRGMFINATRWSIPKSNGVWIWEIGAAGDQFGYSVSTLTYYNICGGWCTKLSWFKWGMCSLHKTYQYQLNCHQKYQQMIVQHYQPTYQPIKKNSWAIRSSWFWSLISDTVILLAVLIVSRTVSALIDLHRFDGIYGTSGITTRSFHDCCCNNY